MHTADFERDPIGTPFDPNQVLAAWKAGTTQAELHRRAYQGDFKPAGPLNLRLPR